MNPGSKRFLDHCLPEHRGAVGSFFYDAARTAREQWGKSADRNLDKVLSARFRTTKAVLDRDGETGAISKAALLRALSGDPDAAREMLTYALAEIDKPLEERQAAKEQSAEAGKCEWMSRQAPTQKQLDLLKRLGHPEVPENRLAASDLIEELRIW